MTRRILILAIGVSLAAHATEPIQVPKLDEYNQWKQALTNAATDAVTLTLPPGFRVELLRSAHTNEGSWVSLTFDPRGRIIIGREDKGLLRLTLTSDHRDVGGVETVNDTLLECRGLLFAFDSLYANANNSKALYRLRDTNGDDRFDEITLLKHTEAGVGHGRNQLTLGPDNRIYVIHGDDVQLPADFTPGMSPMRNYAEDRLLPCEWDRELFGAYVKPPAGHVIRTDRDGKTWELVAGGLRNPFGIAFNTDGEMFTYDADMEWDAGAPWYRPTRVLHLVSGADYGWRKGTGTWHADFPDSLPANLDVGLGSPTAVKFGTKSNFPPKYQRALFILDWAYGRIIAVHMTPRGASYACMSEEFIKGRPLNVTGMEFGPDGAMYFVTGGRKTQSGLYRVSYVGERRKAEGEGRSPEAATARALRHELESFHGHQDPHAVAVAWPHLDSADIWIRHAARIAVEAQPVAEWQTRALEETRPTAALTALMSLARVGTNEMQRALLARLDQIVAGNQPGSAGILPALAGAEAGRMPALPGPWHALSPEQKFMLIRDYALCFMRMGKPDSATVSQVRARLELLYPSDSVSVNEQLCELLVYLDSPVVTRKTLPLLAAAKTQEEKLQYLFTLRNVRAGWTRDERRTYFHWLKEAQYFQGAHQMPKFLHSIKTDAIATLTDVERAQLAPILATLERRVEPLPDMPPRKFVQDWQMSDLVGALGAVGRGRNFERGKAMFTAAMCVRCHLFAGAGAVAGPDLTAVASRFGRRDILNSIMSPSDVIDDKYRNVLIVTTDGENVEGRVTTEDDREIVLSPNLLAPEQTVKVAKSQVQARKTSLLSPMPQGLLVTLTKDEILDLLAYLESGGDAKHRDFQQ